MEGRILDIGGSEKSGYHSLIKGDHTFDINNIDESYGCNLNFDLEKKWPLENESYRGVLAVNVLEHIYDYRHALSESFRVLEKKGKIVIAVPFLIAYHPCPHDYWRFTEETLKKILTDTGFKNIHGNSIGKGIFSAGTNLKYNILQKIPFFWMVNEKVSVTLDYFFSKTKKGKNFTVKNYPMGFVVTAEK